jgi:hypothetical protein
MHTIQIKAEVADVYQIDALKSIFKAMKIKFTLTKEKPYNQEFVNKILEGEKEFKNGEFELIKTEDLWT